MAGHLLPCRHGAKADCGRAAASAAAAADDAIPVPETASHPCDRQLTRVAFAPPAKEGNIGSECEQGFGGRLMAPVVSIAACHTMNSVKIRNDLDRAIYSKILTLRVLRAYAQVPADILQLLLMNRRHFPNLCRAEKHNRIQIIPLKARRGRRVSPGRTIEPIILTHDRPRNSGYFVTNIGLATTSVRIDTDLHIQSAYGRTTANIQCQYAHVQRGKTVEKVTIPRAPESRGDRACYFS